MYLVGSLVGVERKLRALGWVALVFSLLCLSAHSPGAAFPRAVSELVALAIALALLGIGLARGLWLGRVALGIHPRLAIISAKSVASGAQRLFARGRTDGALVDRRSIDYRENALPIAHSLLPRGRGTLTYLSLVAIADALLLGLAWLATSVFCTCGY